MRTQPFDFDKRVRIEELVNKHFCYSGIAKQLGYPVLAIYHEIKNGGGRNSYTAQRAQEIDRIAKDRMRRIQEASQEKVLKELKQRATLARSTYVEEQLKELHDQLAEITLKLGSLHDHISQRERSEGCREAKSAS